MNKETDKVGKDISSKYGNDEKNALRLAAEDLVLKGKKQSRENLEDLTLKKIQMIVHELEVHQIELEMQNEELRRIQSELEIVKARYFDIYDLAPVGYLIVSEKGLILESNLTAATMLGYSRANLIKQRVSQYICKEDMDIYYNHRKHVFETLEPGQCELRMLKNEGTVFWTHMKSVVVTEEGLPICRMVLSDVTARKKAESELLNISYHDYLTGLYNRRFFEEELERLDIEDKLPLSIIMFDVNGLKLVNDSFGHNSGDMLLKKAAEIIKKACREGDIIARIGGDEFAAILPNASASVSIEVANRIKELELKETVANIELSISCGYDTKTIVGQPIIETFANAENQMYRHKLYERSSIRSKTTDLILSELFKKSYRESSHSSRVGRICQAIASKMDLDKEAVNQIRIAGVFHDIGKIGVDESILNKQGNLTSDERRDIEKHSEIGWRLLKATSEFSELAQFVLNHHEKWDGSGYPNGLKGNALELEARIIAVADAYDAMTSEGNYRKPLSKVEAIKELVRCSGTQFDPEIVNVLVNQVLSDIDEF